jgi:uroporphyrinogen decarboxylase
MGILNRSMTSKERVLAAAKGQPVDHVPVFYWFSPHLACRLMYEYQPARNRLINWEGKFIWKRMSQGGGLKSAEIWRAFPHFLTNYAAGNFPLELGADMAIVSIMADDFIRRFFWQNKHLRVLDAFGSVRGVDHGFYLDIIKPAIKKVGDLKAYRFPDYSRDKNYNSIRKMRAAYPGACIVVEAFGVQDFFSTQIWDMPSFMMALYDYPDEVKEFQQHFADWSIDLARRGVKAGADVVLIYDDYGFTGQPFLSVKMWKEFTYPHLRKLIEAVHDAGAVALLHSCGYQPPFLDYYVEAELDMLQSFQPKAGNNFKESYTKYGDRLCFITGIDVQQGEQMTPAQLRENIIESYRTGKIHGRHILGMTHMMQFTMPKENIETVFNTVHEIQSGTHG